MIKYMKKKDFRLSLFSWALAACLLAGVLPSACGEEGQTMVEIESEPEEFAAHLWIALEEGKMPSDEERKQERKRTRLGAGECVSLTLSGKKALIGNPETLKWIIEKGKGDQWATIKRKKDNPTQLSDTILIINQNLTFEAPDPKDPENELGNTPFQTEGTINVQVFQQQDGEQTLIAQKEFTAVLPNKITAEHEDRPISAQDGKEAGALFAKDGDWDPVGASAVLKLTFHPTDVSFRNLAVIEVDMASGKKGRICTSSHRFCWTCTCPPLLPVFSQRKTAAWITSACAKARLK